MVHGEDGDGGGVGAGAAQSVVRVRSALRRACHLRQIAVTSGYVRHFAHAAMSVGPVTPATGGAGVQPAPAAGASPADRVPTAGGAGFAAAAPGAGPTASPLQAALNALAAEALPIQDSLAPLLADLAAVIDSPALPPAARATAQQILASPAPLDGAVTGPALRAAVQSTGLFLEAAIAAALQAPGQTAPPNLNTDLKALLLRLTADLDPAVQAQAAALLAEAEAPRTSAIARRSGARPIPPARGAPTAGEAPAHANPDLISDPDQAPRLILRQAQAALARLQLSQAASAQAEPLKAVWRFDLPVANPAGPGLAQFEISRDGGGAAGGVHDPAHPTWRARFSLDVEPGGPVHAEVSLSNGRTRVTLWAERDSALRDLEAGRAELTAALAGPLGADAAVRVLPGAPPPAPADSPLAGRFLDRTS